MPDHSNDRFDRLLDAMVNKPPLESEIKSHDEPESDDDLREDDAD